jgi:lipopolysaccharide transport system permease protein
MERPLTIQRKDVLVTSVTDLPPDVKAPALKHPSSPGIPPGQPLTVIERKPGWRFIDFPELWRYRELLYFLVWRDVVVRYKQTVLGVAWAVLQPLATMIVFSMFFGRLAEMPTGGVPYPLFVLCGLLPWFFFANSLTAASSSVIGNQSLVTKVYFPRLLIPTGAVAAHLVDLAVAFVLLLGMVAYYGVWFTWGLLLIPLITVGLFVAALGVGTLLAALTVAYRDFRYVVGFLVQLWMFATPTVYMDADVIMGPIGKTWLPLNPAYGLIANFRAAALGHEIDLYSLTLSSAVAVLMLVVGCLYFRRVERAFADII